MPEYFVNPPERTFESQMTTAKSRPLSSSITYVKVCRDCFRDMFGAQLKIQTLTWGRECARCHKPTPTMTTMAKIHADAIRK